MNPAAIISAMITPAVLITACGSLVISTSNRTAGVVAQLRVWAAAYAELAQTSAITTDVDRRALLAELIDLSTRRARLLQRALTALYVAIGLFVATGVAIAGSALLREWGIGWGWHVWVAVALGLMGGGTLLSACSVLITEARLALQHTSQEVTFMSGHREPVAVGSWSMSPDPVPPEPVAENAEDAATVPRGTDP